MCKTENVARHKQDVLKFVRHFDKRQQSKRDGEGEESDIKSAGVDGVILRSSRRGMREKNNPKKERK